jgi:hypothetical protein
MAWRRHLVYRKECRRTTWKLRIGVLVVLAFTIFATRDVWVAQIGRSLVCARDVAPSDVILIENFDPEYLLFERAAELEKAAVAPRAVVPIQMLREPGLPNLVSKGIAEVMARYARVMAWDVVPIRETEPISLNAALQIRDHLTRQRVTSVIIVTGAFRSRRSALVYRTVLGEGGIQVHCEPVISHTTPERWLDTWHGTQGVAEEFLKLQYYRFYVMPFLFHRR